MSSPPRECRVHSVVAGWFTLARHHACSRAALFCTASRNKSAQSKIRKEDSRIAVLSHTYGVKSPLVTMASPKCAPKSTPSHGPIAKPQYLPHPWTCPTYDAKRYLDPIRHFFTMHWTDRPTDRLSTGKFDDYRPLRYESDQRCNDTDWYYNW